MDKLKESIGTLSNTEREALRNKLCNSKDKLKIRKVHNTLYEKKGTNTNSLKFSLFFFSDNGSHDNNGLYQLLLESAKFADENKFHAFWVPERHFHEFGGPYPNPSLLASAIATITKNIKLRAGSVVLPLHHPVRIAEEWSVADNLSNGRIGIACASGWHPGDFILTASSYEDRKNIFYKNLEIIKKLWSGEKLSFDAQDGSQNELEIFPKPIQKHLPIWLTSTTNSKTWEQAAILGANCLTGLMEQSIEELKKKIKLYHEKLEECGHDPSTKEVTVMLHTYVGDDIHQVKEIVRQPLMNYLKMHMKLYESHLSKTGVKNTGIDLNLISEADKQTLLEHGFERYLNHSSFIGTKDTLLKIARNLQEVGVTEIACLISFGLGTHATMNSLEKLRDIKEQFMTDAF